MPISLKTTTGKILASAALIGTAAAVAGLGTYGSFTATTSASSVVNTGNVSLALGGTNNLAVPAVGLLPGDKIERLVTLSNNGDQDFSGVTFTSAATGTPNLMTTDALKGLQVTIESCPTGWVGNAAPYTCANPAVTILAARPIIGAALPLNALNSAANGKSDNLKVTIALPAAADNNFQGLKSAVNFTFDAIQRGGVTK